MTIRCYIIDVLLVVQKRVWNALTLAFPNQVLGAGICIQVVCIQLGSSAMSLASSTIHMGEMARYMTELACCSPVSCIVHISKAFWTAGISRDGQV